LRARRYGSPLSLLLVDVDGLKRINDEGGHTAGDRCCDPLPVRSR
jgi:diguanylate cyclase (GGDEF)-like protein